eukprot:13715483-Ditylum_brightwellii.AAC.1
MANRFQYWTLRLRDTNQWTYFSGRCVSSFCRTARQQNIPRLMYETNLRVFSSSYKKRMEKTNSCFSRKR